MALLQEFISNYQSKNLFTKKDKLLVATSGGVDSVVLCKLCELAGLDFGIAHCNFQLRGNDSDRDEAFVEKFAEQLNVPFFSTRFDTKKYAEQNKASTQVAARELRYHWFEEVAANHNYNFILTAHHADDNIETVVMSFFRGTGIKGLTGIRAKNDKLRRPLLFARRKELEDFLSEHQLPFVQDESNFHDDYTRNYFRNKILPMIAEVYPGANDNILRNIERLKGATVLYNEAVALKRKKILAQKGAEFYMPVLLLQQQKPIQTLLYEMVKDFGFTPAQLKDIIQLLQSESGKYVVSPTHRILRNRKHLVLAPLEETVKTAVIIDGAGKYYFVNGALEIKKTDKLPAFTTDENTALIDAKHLKYPLILRPWKIGDYFYPLGMTKKKKLSRFFINKKLSVIEKEKVWVLEMDKKIIWVVGHRIDDRFKITNATKESLQIKFLQPGN
ncbi:MAG: tRNA lysidine(34) synthetase TilS [Sphingobacteriales bacterium 41-5]|nr:MAG: tRNA lysidine(34) synthetase TilS [Sphingobacteriales bacterium 41-5]